MSVENVTVENMSVEKTSGHHIKLNCTMPNIENSKYVGSLQTKHRTIIGLKGQGFSLLLRLKQKRTTLYISM